jgi:hypothetical protein
MFYKTLGRSFDQETSSYDESINTFRKYILPSEHFETMETVY